jgi:ribosomal protein L17
LAAREHRGIGQALRGSVLKGHRRGRRSLLTHRGLCHASFEFRPAPQSHVLSPRRHVREHGCALIKHEQIKTTLPKAKELRPIVEKLITKAKNGKGSLAARRLAISEIKDEAMVTKLFDVLGRAMRSRPGGYIRVTEGRHPLWRHAPMAVIDSSTAILKPRARIPDRSTPARRKKAARAMS